MYGTSLGVDLSKGSGVEHGHEHHLRAINRIRAYGSIPNAVAAGALTSAGSCTPWWRPAAPTCWWARCETTVRCPTSSPTSSQVSGRCAARLRTSASPSWSRRCCAIGTGNLLPASIPLVCVDINPATVTRLADRGSSHATGVVTDIGLFLEQLADELVPGRSRG